MSHLALLLLLLPTAFAFCPLLQLPVAHAPLRRAAAAEEGADKQVVVGWQSFFASQLETAATAAAADEELVPVRVTEVRAKGLCVRGMLGMDTIIPLPPPSKEQTAVVVGDWILVTQQQGRLKKILDRKNVIQRRAPGRNKRIQSIAANLDTCFVVTSCNQDFNIARLERYCAMVLQDDDVAPVIVLTKKDQLVIHDNDDDEESSWLLDFYSKQAKAISPDIPVVLLDARGNEAVIETLGEKWCGSGQTVAFVGSSGVGKSTLVNSLFGGIKVENVGKIHDDSGQGRHTTTRRQLHFLPNGCAILDTPGLRELQLIGASKGVSRVFADLVNTSKQCRFNDCQHDGEPGCAIEAAIERGEVDCERYDRWQKLVEEDMVNTKAMAEIQRNQNNQEKKKKARVQKRPKKHKRFTE